jgi:mono/diheme cytochrome c family protein
MNRGWPARARAAFRSALDAGLLLAVLVLASCSLAQDVTPPPGYVTAPPPDPTSVAESQVSFPLTRPSSVRGAEVYAENCTRCHGEGGAGDGPVAAQIEFPMPAFVDPELAFTTTPQRWFSIITNGNLERLMPPWGEALSAADRWHLVAHLYGLSLSADRLEDGRQVYQAGCAGCHGQDGTGNGPEAAGPMPDFTDQPFMAVQSNQAFLSTLTEAAGPHQPAGGLSEPELRSVVDYVRSLSFSAEAPETGRGTIAGAVSHGTQGAGVPPGQTVELHIYDDFQETGLLTSSLDSAGRFEFKDVPLPPGRAFVAAAEYSGVLYASEVGEASEGATHYDLPVTLYDTTTDPSNLVIERMHVVVEFGSEVVQVGELITLSNNGDTTLVATAPGGPTALFALPGGFTNLSFQGGGLGDRYQLLADGFGDTVPIVPGPETRQMLFSFTLPYSSSLAFAQPVFYAARSVEILVPEGGVTFSGPGLVDQGLKDTQGRTYHAYSLADLEPGETIAFSLLGRPTDDGASGASSSVSRRTLLIGGLTFGLVLAMIAYWWVGRRAARTPAPAPAGTASRDRLLQSIAELDDAFEAGKISETEHRAKREKLKARLKALMQ